VLTITGGVVPYIAFGGLIGTDATGMNDGMIRPSRLSN
jgi:hypothetical protein